MKNVVAKYPEKATGKILFIVGGLIFLYTVFRAFVLSFTWDESYSYLEFIRNGILFPLKYEVMSANNHLLNTWLNIYLIKIFGVSEFVLRLPSLCSHVLFLFFSYKLVNGFENKWLVIISFLIINLNPYLLDFFSLSRGYGLSMGLMMASIYYLHAFYTKGYKTKQAVVTIFFGFLASMANFIMLNYLVVLMALLIGLIWISVWQSNLKWKEKIIRFTKSLALPGAIFCFSMLIIIPVILKLKEAGALFYGGEKSFWTDTFSTITDKCFYGHEYYYWFHRIAKGFIILIITSSVIFLTIDFLKKKVDGKKLFLFPLLFLLCTCAFSTIVQHYLFGTLYLVNRTALFLVVLFNLVFVFFINELSREKRAVAKITYIIGGIVTIHFILSANTNYVLEWKSGSDIKQMIDDLDKIKTIPKEKNNITISIPLEFDAGINFYRAKDNIAWINTAEQSDIDDMRYDYFFLSPAEYREFNMDSLEIIKTYPQTQNILARQKFPEKAVYTYLKDSLDFASKAEKYYFLDEKTGCATGFNYKLTDSIVLNKNAEVVLEASVMTTDISKANLYVIISFENDAGIYIRKSACVNDYIRKNNECATIYFSCLIPKEVKPGDVLKSYIWNPHQQKLYIRKMKFKWLSKSQK